MMAGDLLGERARVTPDKLALIEVRSGRRFTYRDLNRRASALSGVWLKQCGLGRGDRVGILSENRVEYVDAFFAAGKTGVVLVPLNSRLSVEELGVTVKDAALRSVFYSAAHGEAAGRLRQILAVDDWTCIDNVDLESASDPGAADCDPEDLWCLLYTSGTTGRPKGVMLPHRMILWNGFNTVASWQLRDDDVAPIFTPMCHAGGLSVLLTPIFTIGGTIVLHERFDAATVLRAAQSERATILFGVPTTFKMLLDAPEFEAADLTSVRWCISGGAPLPRYLIDAYRRRGLVFKQGYGLTEAGVNCFAMTSEDAERKPGSIGRPMLFAQTRLANETGEPAATGETGEVWLRGQHVAKGFWNQPEATAMAIDRDGWLHTGDLAHCDADGFYYIDGRLKDMFISGGLNVYPAEIESLLLQHPAVAEAAVFGIPDETWGEVGVAAVVPSPGAKPRWEEIVAFLAPKMARYKLPKSLYLVAALPRTDYGKVLKQELRKQYRDSLQMA